MLFRSISHPFLLDNEDKRFVQLNDNQFVGKIMWIKDAPPLICNADEVYNSEAVKCISKNTALGFSRGVTHPITITTAVVEQNFTVEFWIRMVKLESTFQDILRGDYFIVRFEADSKFRQEQTKQLKDDKVS